MFVTCLALAALLGFATAAPEREKRLLIGNGSCRNQLQLLNPCTRGQGRFPVTGDVSKFIQCDSMYRAYIVECPAGLQYNQATRSCQPSASTGTEIGLCSTRYVTTGQIYFPYAADRTKFYVCTDVGQVRVMKCPSRLAWDPYRVACVYMYPATGHIVANPSITPSWAWQFTNPCTPRQLAGNHHYFAHPDPTRFIQCDNAGQAFVVSCPSGLVWNQYSETCLSKFSNVVVA